MSKTWAEAKENLKRFKEMMKRLGIKPKKLRTESTVGKWGWESEITWRLDV